MRWQSLLRSFTRGVRFVAFPQDRVQQRLVQRSSLTLQFLRDGGWVAEVFKVTCLVLARWDEPGWGSWGAISAAFQ